MATVLAVLALAPLPLAAQEFGEAIEVRLINVDVYVTDEAGNRVQGLTKDDLVLLENGKPRTISNFSAYGATAAPAPPAEDARTPAAQTFVERPQPRTFAFIVDQMPAHSIHREAAFAELKKFVRTSMREGDSAMIAGWERGGLRPVVDLTSDRTLIERALDALAGRIVAPELVAESGAREHTLDRARVMEHERAARAGRASTSPPPPASSAFDVTDDERFVILDCASYYVAEVRRKTAAMRAVVGRLRGREGKRAIIYVANRFPRNTAAYCGTLGGQRAELKRISSPQFNTDDYIREAARDANAAGISFYALRPEIPRTMVSAATSSMAGAASEATKDVIEIQNELLSLRELTEETGGLLAYGPSEMAAILPEISEDMDSYYSLAYRAGGGEKDRPRKIRVTVKNREYTVRTRRAIVEKSNEAWARDRVVANIDGISGTADFPVKLAAGARKPQRGGRFLVPLQILFPTARLQFVNGRARVGILIASADAAGEPPTVHEQWLELEEGKTPAVIRYDVDIANDAKGNVTSIGVVDAASGQTGFARIDTRRAGGES